MSFDYRGGTDSTWIKENTWIDHIFTYVASDTTFYGNQDPLANDTLHWGWFDIYQKGHAIKIKVHENDTPFQRDANICLSAGIVFGSIRIKQTEQKRFGQE